MEYSDFLTAKQTNGQATGRRVSDAETNQVLFPFQRDLVRWALRKGRAAVFADTGMGKTFVQIEWARLSEARTLIVAPLSVGRQTVKEGLKIGVTVKQARRETEATGQINITNYEMVEHFDPSAYGAVVLDESSILKALDGATRQCLTDMFARTPYRLCCTATPAPNDITEIANHAEFLGIMTRAEILSAFFVHDDEGWRLKGHATGPFFKWLASWAMSIKKPSDLGYDDDGFILPDLTVEPHFLDVSCTAPGQLFGGNLKGIQGRTRVRRQTLLPKVEAAAELMTDGEQWIAWVGLNDEGRELHRRVPGSALMEGQDSVEDKVEAIEGFQDGRYRVLISKAKIAGFGINLQHAHKVCFVGLSDSWEAWYQCIRRCWRFGQAHPVQVHVILSEAERPVYENVLRKEEEARRMSEHLIANVQEFEREELAEGEGDAPYEVATVKGEDYALMLGDSAERLAELEADSVHLSIFSPPFLSLYTYSPSPRDVGNSRTEDEFYRHFGFIIRELLRITVPGRNCCVHVAQVPAMLCRDGYIGLKDFRGKTISAFEDHGWVYHGEVAVDKDPQAQAIRTKSKALLFVQLRKDASWLRPALADYILVFRKPGENLVPIHPDITNDQWIEWARPVWYGIHESDTLNVAEGREPDDERHICPLQLGTIDRCLMLWSNQGETICDPFAGIGSTGYQALLRWRRFVGLELKGTYFRVAQRNLERALVVRAQASLFGMSQAT